jgi:serine/threonine protein kinase
MSGCFKQDPHIKAANYLLPGYTCVKLLGSGAFASVYLMKSKTGKKLALRISHFNEEDMIDEKILNILKNKCSKRRIICLDKVFHVKPFFTYIVTEFIDGGDLYGWIGKHEKLIYKVMGQLIDAVEYIHSKKIVHFDIKPDNIVATSDDNIKLIDFGGSSLIDKNGLVHSRGMTILFSPNDYQWDPSFERGKYHDWYSVLMTLDDLLYSKIKKTPKDLLDFRYKTKPKFSISEVYNRIHDLKKIIANNIHMTNKNKEDFIDPAYKSSVRNTFEKAVLCKDGYKPNLKGNCVKYPDPKIINPLTGRCKKPDGEGKKPVVVGRKAPKSHAKIYSTNAQKKGIDGNVWEVVKNKNGIKRWKKV